jgi:hypothetical protein
LLPSLYKSGRKRLPYRRGDREAVWFTEAFRKELIEFPDGATNDMVMADWFGEWNLEQIAERVRRRRVRISPTPPGLPPYLRRQLAGNGAATRNVVTANPARSPMTMAGWTPPGRLNPSLASLGIERVTSGRWATSLRCRTCGALWVPRRDPATGELPVDYWLCPQDCNSNVWEGWLVNGDRPDSTFPWRSTRHVPRWKARRTHWRKPRRSSTLTPHLGGREIQ